MKTNDAVIKFTEEKIASNTQLQFFINKSRSVANVIFPETLPFSDNYCKLGVEVVTVDVKNDRDVYKNESGGLCLHLSKLNEIAKAAKIRVVDSKILERKTDERGNVTFISHQVKVQYRTVAGEMITESYTGKYDYFNDLSTKKEGQVKSRRKHAEALAESNALTRAFNKVLPQLPQSFQPNELEKPFLIPYVEEDKNAVLRDLPVEDQKIIKNELARKRLGLMDTIYAPPAGSEASPTRTQVQEAEVVEEEKPKFTPEEEIHLQVETYRDVPQKERTEKILTLIKLKQFEDPKGGTFTASRIEKNTLDKQLQFMEKLLNLPDAEEGLPVD